MKTDTTAPLLPHQAPSDVRKARLLLLGWAHLVADGYLGFVPALLPFFVDRLGISMAMAGALVTIASLCASLCQPIFGYLSDRAPGRIFASVGPALSAVGISALAFARSYPLAAMFIAVGALGNAFFHPQGAAIAADTGGLRRRGIATSLFSAGGIIGYGVSPLFIVWFVERFGIEKMWTLAPVGVLTALAVSRYGGATWGDSGEEAVAKLRWGLKRAWVALSVLAVIVTCRSAASIVMNTFTPLLMKARGLPPSAGATALAVFIGAGGLSMMLGGYLSDHIGRRSVTVVSLLTSAPLLWAFLHMHGPLALVVLALAGATLSGATAVNIVQAQELLPEGAGLASSMTMGLCWGLGSLFNLLVGKLADARGVPSALHIAVLLALAAGITAVLPVRRRA